MVSLSGFGIIYWPRGMSWEGLPPLLFFGRIYEGWCFLNVRLAVKPSLPEVILWVVLKLPVQSLNCYRSTCISISF